MLTLLVIWSIVALVCWCSYRLWYWTPTASDRHAARLPARGSAERKEQRAA